MPAAPPRPDSSPRSARSLWRAGVPATVRGSLTHEPPAAVGQVLHGAVRSLLEDVATRTGATRVEVEVNEIESQLEVTVRDDGSDNTLRRPHGASTLPSPLPRPVEP